MARKPAFPPPIYTKGDYSFCRVQGRHRHLGKTDSEEARQKYAALLDELTNHPPPPPTTDATPAVAGLVARFLAHAETSYIARGREVAQFRLSFRPLLRLHGATPAADFGPKALREVQAAMASGSWMTAEEVAKAAQRRHPIGWCRNVVNRRIVRIRTAWRWLESEQLVPPGSTAALRTMKELPRNAAHVRQTKRRTGTPWDDLLAVLPFCPPPVQMMLQIQWWSGCRSQDVRLMTAADIDTSGETWVYTPALDKGDWRDGSEESPRVVYLGPECQALLTSWVDAYPGAIEGYLFAPLRRRRQACYTTFSYTLAVRRASDAAGVKVLPYGGRHAAKDRVTRAAGLDAARAFLGQKSLNSTNSYGQQLDRQTGEDVARRVG